MAIERYQKKGIGNPKEVASGKKEKAEGGAPALSINPRESDERFRFNAAIKADRKSALGISPESDTVDEDTLDQLGIEKKEPRLSDE
ncbi:MAG: hypothetical protein Q7S05_03960 [bacterium]|nr:hypothetical protein [bacterium]